MTFDTIRAQVANRQARLGPLFEREMERRLKAAAPIKTGLTRAKTRARLTTFTVPGQIAPLMRWEAEAGTEYASFPEEGTRAHPITARPGSVLAFYWPKVGRFVFFAKVNHPGNPPRPWFRPTLEQTMKLMVSLWRRF